MASWGTAWCIGACRCLAWQARRVASGLGESSYGVAWQAGPGMSGQGEVRRVMARHGRQGQARRVLAWHESLRQGNWWQAGHGWVRSGMAGLGKVFVSKFMEVLQWQTLSRLAGS